MFPTQTQRRNLKRLINNHAAVILAEIQQYPKKEQFLSRVLEGLFDGHKKAIGESVKDQVRPEYLQGRDMAAKALEHVLNKNYRPPKRYTKASGGLVSSNQDAYKTRHWMVPVMEFSDEQLVDGVIYKTNSSLRKKVAFGKILQEHPL